MTLTLQKFSEKRLGIFLRLGMFTVIQTGTIAAVAVAFGKFSAYLSRAQ